MNLGTLFLLAFDSAVFVGLAVGILIRRNPMSLRERWLWIIGAGCLAYAIAGFICLAF